MNRRQLLRTGALAVSGLTTLQVSELIKPNIAVAKAQRKSKPAPMKRGGARYGEIAPANPTVEFGSTPSDVITTQSVEGKVPYELRAHPGALVKTDGGVVLVSTPGAAKPMTHVDLANQFFAFQAELVNGSPVLLETSDVEPMVGTPDATPDVVLDMSLQAFHLGESEPVDRETRATLRLTLNKDDDSTRARNLETLYWGITTALRLYDDETGKKTESKELKTDYRKALGNKNIEIPGALADVKLEVIKHKEPRWWRNVFSFLGSNGAKTLTAALGFPAVTQQVIKFVDEAASRLEGTNPEVLFASRSMKLAFSKEARASYVGNGPIKIGCLNPGTWVLARGRDFQTLANAQALFYATYGKLVPAKVPITDTLVPGYVDPFNDVTYAVLRVQMKPQKLNLD